MIDTGAFELKLQEMGNDDERKAYQEETKCFTNLDKIIVQVYAIDRTVINNWMITMTIKTIMIMMTMMTTKMMTMMTVKIL